MAEGATSQIPVTFLQQTPSSVDVLTGRWQLVPQRSVFTTPTPNAWTIEIVTSPEHIVVHQALTRADGSRVSVALDAPCDGRAHRVTGSPIVDEVVYARLDSRTLIGVGEKGSEVTLKVMLSASGGGRSLLMDYTTYQHGVPATRGIAVFSRVE